MQLIVINCCPALVQIQVVVNCSKMSVFLCWDVGTGSSRRSWTVFRRILLRETELRLFSNRKRRTLFRYISKDTTFDSSGKCLFFLC